MAGNLDPSEFTLTWPEPVNNIGVVGYEVSVDNGDNWQSQEGLTSLNFYDLVPNKKPRVIVRQSAVDGNRTTSFPKLPSRILTALLKQYQRGLS